MNVFRFKLYRNKNLIMLRFVIFNLVILLATVSFSQNSEKNKKVKSKIKSEVKEVEVDTNLYKPNNENHNVKIYFSHYYPYCGGAYPTDEQQNNYVIRNYEKFALINIDTNDTLFVKTDSVGYLKLNLPQGNYKIKEMYQLCSFNEFLSKYQTNESGYVQSDGQNCYRSWWESSLIEFTITGSTPLQNSVTTADRCFVGSNPCLFYNGPYPP